jgi:hypothetical protein
MPSQPKVTPPTMPSFAVADTGEPMAQHYINKHDPLDDFITQLDDEGHPYAYDHKAPDVDLMEKAQ